MERVRRLEGNLYQIRPVSSDVSTEQSALTAFNNGLRAESEAVTNGSNDFRRALRFYNKAVSCGTHVSVRALINIGSIKFRLSDFPSALFFYNKARIINTRYAPAYYSIGLCLERLERENEAIDNYCVAIKLEPLYFEAHYNLGFVFYGRGEYQFAFIHLKKALECRDASMDSKIRIQKVIEKIEESGKVDTSGRTLVLVKSRPIEIFSADREF
jgi:tetratricopeptide (TPR) repeat protein